MTNIISIIDTIISNHDWAEGDALIARTISEAIVDTPTLNEWDGGVLGWFYAGESTRNALFSLRDILADGGVTALATFLEECEMEAAGDGYDDNYDDGMDGDHASALESVYGPND